MAALRKIALWKGASLLALNVRSTTILVACCLAACCLSSCGIGNRKLDEIEKARLIKEKRLEARDVLQKFKASGEKDLDLIERYTELRRENTEIAPATCPVCWAEYGEALSMLGWFYWYVDQDVQEELKKARPTERKLLEKESEEYREKWENYFQQSNQAYETHFRSTGIPAIHPYSYERVMRHYELLGNYESALFYLEKCTEAFQQYGLLDEPIKQKINKLKRLYKQEVQLQKERESEEDQGSLKSPLPRPAAGSSKKEPSPLKSRG